MKLRADELKKRAAEAGLTAQDLADAVSRTGLSGQAALSAVRNWIGGRDHPRCKRADVDAMAGAVGCEAKDIARFVSRVNHHRGSQRKARLVTDLVRGRDIDDAKNQLRFSTKRAAVNVLKAIQAAEADAMAAGADAAALVVTEARVDGAQHIKRFQPKDRGRAHPILKRTSHITIGVQEKPGVAAY